MGRLSVLPEHEVQELFGIPRFSKDAREIYFSLDPNELQIFESLRLINTKVLFLLQLGYFKASHQFFVFSWQDVGEDRNYLVERYFPGKNVPETMPDKNTRLSQQRLILQCHEFRGFGVGERVN